MFMKLSNYNAPLDVQSKTKTSLEFLFLLPPMNSAEHYTDVKKICK